MTQTNFRDYVESTISRYITHTDKPAQVEKSFRNHLRDSIRTLFLWFLWTDLLLILFTWPFDFILYEDTKLINAFVNWKSVNVAWCLFFLIGLHYSEWFRDRYVELIILFLPCLLLVINLEISRFPSMHHLFTVAFIFPAPTMVLPLRLSMRILTVVVFSLVSIIPFVFLNPVIATDPYLSARLLVFGGFMTAYIVAGHLWLHLARRLYFHPSPLSNQ